MQFSRTILHSFWALFVVFAFASCIDNGFVDDTNGNSDDRTASAYSLFFQFDMGDFATRAASGDLVNGDTPEHIIGTTGNYVFFFHEDGSFFSADILELANGDPLFSDPNHPDHQVEKTYTAQITDEDGTLPKKLYAVVVLNCQRIFDQLSTQASKNVTLTTLMQEIWDNTDKDPLQIGRNDNDYFTLTNSSYIKDGARVNAVLIDVDQMKQTSDLFLDKSKVVTIHVERMLAKSTFASNKETFPIFQPSVDPDIIFVEGMDEEGYPIYAARRWRVNVTGWNLNALEAQSYLFKNIGTGNENQYYFTGWNDPNNYRTHWCQDTHYTNTDYPWQHRWAMDMACPYYSDKWTANSNTNMLRNYSFDDLRLAAKDFSATFYVPENTYDSLSVAGRLDNREDLLAGTHLLVGAELQIETDLNSNQYEAIDVYRDRSGFFYRKERECVAAMVHAFNQTLSSHDLLEFTYYDWDSQNRNMPELVAKSDGDCVLYWKNNELTEQEIYEMSDEEFYSMMGEMVPATILNGDGKRLPWCANWLRNYATNPTDGLRIYNKATRRSITIHEIVLNGYGTATAGRELRTANVNDVKSLLYEWLGPIEHYNNGKMYYAAGIDNPVNSTVMPGHYGVVRNNWYQFNLKDINSIGVPVDNTSEPIVPGRIGANDQINVSINIIDWHRVESTLPNI